MKIIVVGANHAGIAAINTLLSNKKQEDEVIVFEKNSRVSFLGCGMALWIGKQIEDDDNALFYSSIEKLESKGAKVKSNFEVVRIDYKNKIAYAKDVLTGKEICESFDKIIIATGSKVRELNVKGSKLENVMYVKTHDSAKIVVEKIKSANVKNIVIVGAGYIGVELAEAFKRLNKDVTVIDVQDKPLSGYYDENLTTLMLENLKKHGIKVSMNEEVKEFVGHTYVEKVVTNKGTYDADLVLIAVGFLPNSDLFDDAKFKKLPNGAIIVKRTQETSIKGVYAIGDCATIYDNSIQNDNYIALATNAVRTGIVAANNVLGHKLKSPGVQGSNGISIYGLNMVSTGLTQAKAKIYGYDAKLITYEDLQKPGFMRENEKVYINLVYDAKTRRLLGAQMASRYDISMGMHMFSLAIQQSLTIDDLKLLDILFLPHFNQPYNYITMALNKE